jgi:gluconolactonase
MMWTVPLPPSLLAPTARLERVATGAAWSEGPLWLPDLGVLRWSDIPNNRILEYRPSDHFQRVYRDQVEFTNGRTLDLDGRVVQCSHGRRRLEWDGDPAPIGIVDRWNGARLNSPNDVVVARDGAIWFSDPPYGITQPNEGHPGVREYGDHYVFRHDVATSTTAAMVVDVEEPNGLAFSPGEEVLYIADSSAVRRPPGVGNHHIRAYDVVDGRRCKNGRVFAVIDRGFPDGIRVDVQGNVWSSAADGVHVFAPDGEELGVIPVPELVGNLCFGGPDGSDLYVAASTSIYRIPTEVRDAAQHF